MGKIYDGIVEHVIRDLSTGEPMGPKERLLVARAINVLFALGYIPSAPIMEQMRKEHVSVLKAQGISDAAIG